jgi:uncharacterized protein YidB (DUF937 family)
MSLLEQILSGALGGAMPQQSGQQSAAPQGNALLNLALQFVQNYPGGLAGLVQAFSNAGAGEQAKSWVGTGRNLPISPDIITQILGGQQQVRSMGAQYGLESQMTAGGLASLLPEIINQMTPQGHLENRQQDDLGALLESVRGKLTN